MGRAAPAPAPDELTDCGLPNATMHFDSVVSTNPVHTHETQFINKTLHFDKVYSNMTCTYEQYWEVLGHWVRFLKLNVNACAEHPQLCKAGGAQVGKEIFVETKHPPLNPLAAWCTGVTAHTDVDSGEVIGCVDMMIPYVK